MRRLFEACMVSQQQTGRFPQDFRHLAGFLSEDLLHRMPVAVEFKDPESGDNRLKRLSPIGNRTPCLRLELTDDHWLNVATSGWIFQSQRYWECEFVDLFPRPYMNPDMLARDFRPIPDRVGKRSSLCGADQIDLASYFNAIPSTPWFQGQNQRTAEDWLNAPGDQGPAFQVQLESGILEDGGILFDVRGVIQLDGELTATDKGSRQYRSYPLRVSRIGVGRIAARFEVLAGTIDSAPAGAVVATLELHYEFNRSATLPLRYQIEFAAADDATLLFNRIFPASVFCRDGPMGSLGYSLYHISLENPFPYERIQSMDFVSGVTTSHPYILAITVVP